MKVFIKDLIELPERITHHSNEYDRIADKKILVARYGNKLYIVDGHARVRKAKDRGDKEIEAEIINVNSYEEIVKKHIEVNQRGIIDNIALAIVCKRYNFGYLSKELLDKLDIEALKILEEAIKKYEYKAKTEIPIMLLEVISKIPLELQKEFVKILLKNYKLVKGDVIVLVNSLGYVITADEFLAYKQKKGEPIPVPIPTPSGSSTSGDSKPSDEDNASKPDNKPDDNKPEGDNKPDSKPEDTDEEGRVLKKGDILEFNSIEELLAFINTDRDRLPKFAFFKLESLYESRKDLIENRPSNIKLEVV